MTIDPETFEFEYSTTRQWLVLNERIHRLPIFFPVRLVSLPPRSRIGLGAALPCTQDKAPFSHQDISHMILRTLLDGKSVSSRTTRERAFSSRIVLSS
jgi:hypothetical protein